MNLADKRPKQLGASFATPDETALSRCRQAAGLIFCGQYEDARDTLGPIWQGVGERPLLPGQDDAVRAEALLQCGVLSGWLGSCQHLAGAQEAAKDLIGEAQRVFETLDRPSRVAEAQYELSICYWRLGSVDEARVMLAEALRGLGEAETELRAKVLIRQTLVEISASRYREAWNILRAAEAVFESAGDALKGRWHGQRAIVLLQLATAENRPDYSDRAIIEFTAAVFHYEQAGHERHCGSNLNNLAFLLYKLGRNGEAHEHLDRARRIFTRLKDSGVAAQVDETRARVLVAEGRYVEAKVVIAGALGALREGGEQALLADALVVQGVAQARLGEHEVSIATLREAMTTAELAGAPESAGHAALTLIEEHGRGRLPGEEAYELYRRADEWLARTQDAEDLSRLRACARVVMQRCGGVEMPEGFSLPRAVRAYEARFIEQALTEEGGSVSRAARRLGVKHQSLSHTLQARHRQLLAARTPAVPRRRSIIRIKEARAKGH
jgi:tetratricopeptide (TPR) repeat protein